MRIAVAGAGAMGSWFGAQLALHGNSVQLLTTNQSHINAIENKGLRLQSADAEQCLDIQACLPGQIATPVDLILLFTKSFQSDAAMAAIAHALGETTQVLSLQNGLGNAELIAAHVAAERIWIGVTLMPVDRVAPGVVACKGSGPAWFGPAFPCQGTAQERERERILAAFSSTPLQLQYDPDIHRRVWEKVAFNAGMNALSALSMGTPGTIGEAPGAKDLARDIAAEVAATAEAFDVIIDLDSVFSTIDFACANHQNHKPSMRQDLEAGKKTEIDALCGAVSRMASARGIATPLNSVLTTLVRLAEHSRKSADSGQPNPGGPAPD